MMASFMMVVIWVAFGRWLQRKYARARSPVEAAQSWPPWPHKIEFLCREHMISSTQFSLFPLDLSQ